MRSKNADHTTPRLKDIAERAGVSLATASGALNGYTKSRIKRETIDRVNRIAKEMGYRPNAIARSLKYQRTNTIAFYTGYGFCDVRDRFLGEVVTGIQHACDDLDLNLLLFGNLSRRPVAEIHRELTSGKIDGVVVHAAPNDPVVEMLANGSLPTVAIADAQPLLPSVVADDEGGMRMLIDYLWSRGHRRICFSTPEGRFESVERRRVAFEDAIRAKGGEPIVLHIPWQNTVGYMRALMGVKSHPTAVCCWHDDTAYYLLQTCQVMGIRVPEELAVAGFDALQEGRLPGRHLVTVEVPWREMAYKAAQSVIALRDGGAVTPVVRFSTALHEGDTA